MECLEEMDRVGKFLVVNGGTTSGHHSSQFCELCVFVYKRKKGLNYLVDSFERRIRGTANTVGKALARNLLCAFCAMLGLLMGPGQLE